MHKNNSTPATDIQRVLNELLILVHNSSHLVSSEQLLTTLAKNERVPLSMARSAMFFGLENGLLKEEQRDYSPHPGLRQTITLPQPYESTEYHDGIVRWVVDLVSTSPQGKERITVFLDYALEVVQNDFDQAKDVKDLFGNTPVITYADIISAIHKAREQGLVRIEIYNGRIIFIKPEDRKSTSV